jgi:hypothetical protein
MSKKLFYTLLAVLMLASLVLSASAIPNMGLIRGWQSEKEKIFKPTF